MSEPRTSHGPARISAIVASGGAGLSAVAGLGGDGWWVLLAPLGGALAFVGLWRAEWRYLGVGCSGLFCAALVTGLSGGHPARLGIAVAGAFVAWDVGEHAITLGEQLGRRADTWRLEVLQAGVSVATATVGVGAVSLTYLLAGGGQPLLALLLLLIGAAALLASLRGHGR